jgi:hypothetical protein
MSVNHHRFAAYFMDKHQKKGNRPKGVRVHDVANCHRVLAESDAISFEQLQHSQRVLNACEDAAFPARPKDQVHAHHCVVDCARAAIVHLG